MKKIIIIVSSILVLLCCVLIGLNIFDKDEKIIDSDPIVEIMFPQRAGEYNTDVEFVFKDDYEIENKEILNTSYTTYNSDIDKLVRKIRNRYNVSNKKEDTKFMVRIGKNDRVITKYGDNAIHFSNDVDMSGEVTVADDKCKSIAEKELKKLGLLKEGMVYDGIAYDTQTDLQNNEETIIAKTVCYNRKIEGIEVRGNSSVSITIVGDGDIKSIYYIYGEINKKHEIADENIIPIEKAIEECKKFNGQVIMPDDYDEIVIEKVECVWWEDSSPGSMNKAIQPVYKFVGKAYLDGEECGEFVAIESALKK